jgi:hypothetical protein
MIECPFTGEVIDEDDIDALAELFLRVKDEESKLRTLKRRVSERLAERADPLLRTSRVRGEKYRVKIEQPKTSYEQRTLKKLWDGYPSYARQYLRIGKIDVQAREFLKLQNEAGPDVFMEFREQLMGAYRGAVGTPRITVEE